MTNESKQVQQLKEEIVELKKQLEESEELIKEISAPIIPSIVPETILVPITGRLSPERFEMIITKILNVTYQEDIHTIIIDFSAISEKDICEMDVFGMYVDNLAKAIGLMGIEVLFVGFTPSLTQIIVNSGVREILEMKSFLTFRTALQYLMKRRGIEFQPIND
ncbi:STAS domain-containing protein [Rossellomorea aquimaris]|uniref:STAS domain-containing protein n=1 Tax=Rossellomorea aquimaris TaxID=189382 RepID=UPI001CD4A06C|nr:STAS domain-containing protein [Rossellomorea aquimaris]MCA1056575.1 STAS domain-containing protein [Rossellomorea aquimaris]